MPSITVFLTWPVLVHEPLVQSRFQGMTLHAVYVYMMRPLCQEDFYTPLFHSHV